MKLEISERDYDRIMTALANAGRDCDKLAAEAETAADAGHSDGLVYDYAPLAGVFRDSARCYRDTAERLASEYERADEEDD
jgi:hypothetical protein